ncbi:type VI secretion system-associated protein TagF [Roseobacter sp. SK209-2-6]|uniref:type VI secretion system-associated protein TagF n=1 Tax=Roseobacter sp. SK209-2-6 TaxID=388739 RepID=UPI0002FD93BC|nr:type VI secretion system-associated protein TagF [Roseobacter sp. SK209-2-6]
MSAVNVMEGGFGAFGKMPTVGDFFRINAPNSFVRGWDSWIQEILLEGQDTYGAGFDPLYMSAPIWRFTLPAGLAGASKVMGILMPSIDRVERRFPLTLMCPLATPGPPALDHLRETALFEQLEDIALASLEDDASREQLAQQLAKLTIPDLRDAVPLRAAAQTLVLTGTGEGTALETHLAAALLARHAPKCSLWTTQLEGGPRLLVSPELPRGETARGLFDLSAPIWREAQPI